MKNINYDFNKIFGGFAYKLSLCNAIQNNYVTNYKILLPSENDDMNDIITDINNVIDIDMTNKINIKCLFLLKGITLHMNKKCIVYCKSHEEIELFKKSFIELNKYFALNLKIFSITCDDNNSINIKKYNVNSRQWKLQQFEIYEGISLILSVRILDECIDIKSCDSVYFSSLILNETRIIQRICRCTRKIHDNLNKIGYVYV
jgi:predicted helicase